MTLRWRGAGSTSRRSTRQTGRTLVRVDPRYFRPTEVDTLLGDRVESAAPARLVARSRASRSSCARWSSPIWQLAQRDALVEREGFAAYKHHE